jgi:hypothetical protein
MKERQKRIEKPWAVYMLGGRLSGIGRVVSDKPDILRVQYCEGKYYPPKLGKIQVIERFDLSKEVIDYYIKTKLIFDKETHKALTNLIELFFPEALKNEQLQSGHTMPSHYPTRSQSSPKCTKTKYDSFGILPPFGI